MDNRIVGLFLIGLTLLTAVIAYSVGELMDAIKASSAYVAGSITGGGGQLDWGGGPISTIPIILILISLIIGIIIFIRNEK